MLPSSHAALAKIIVPNCNNNINVLAWPVSHNIFKPENGRHARKITDINEKNGRSHAKTDNIQRPNESIPGWRIATDIDIAIIKLVNGTETNGLKITAGTFSNPTISNNNPAVINIPQKTAITIAA